jgi:imidazolonepropionase-like amidohydrolase
MMADNHLILENFDLLDVDRGELLTGQSLEIRGDRIHAVVHGSIPDPSARRMNLGGRVLMPGLIDCHIHVCADAMTSRAPLFPALAVAKSSHLLHDTLMRGFTTIRDTGGADAGYRDAVEQGLFLGPRMKVSGRPISQTGGHGDSRATSDFCAPCRDHAVYFALADGVDEVRKAIREEIRRGADQIKIMASGGISSPADPIDYLQYSTEELIAAVDEAQRAHKYVMAHAYTAEAIERAVEAGVRSVEHGNFLDEKCAAMMAARGTFLVPTLVVYRRIISHGHLVDAAPGHLEKARQVLDSGTRSLEIAHRAGVKMAFGTDLFKAPKEFQTEEFLVRAEVLSHAQILRSATTVAAELMRMDKQIGRIQPGYLADLLVVEGNPLLDFSCLQDQGAQIPVIFKGGQRVKDLLSSDVPPVLVPSKSLGNQYRALRPVPR